MTGGESGVAEGARRGLRRVLGVAFALIVGGGVVVLLGRLGGAPGPGANPGVVPAAADGVDRVVSLSPAITQWVLELGRADTLVGVGDGDAFAPQGVPSVGTFFDVDLERLAGLMPTRVLAATAPEKLPAALRAAAERGGFALNAHRYPASLDDALAVGGRVGAALGDAAGGIARSVALRGRLNAVARAVAGRPPVRALLLFSTQPLQACGAGTVHDELLRLAGGVNVFDATAGTAPTLDRELLRGLAPKVVFLMRPGAAPGRDAGDPRLAGLGGLEARAGVAGRVVLLHDPAVLLAGPTMDTTAVSFAVALHPERARAVAQAYAQASGLPVAPGVTP